MRHPAVTCCAVALAVAWLGRASAEEAAPAAKTKLKDELRLPWTRGDQGYIRRWLVLGPIPGELATDGLKSQGGESGVRPREGMELERSDGSAAKWHGLTAWFDAVGLEELGGDQDGVVGYAFATVTRASAGKALLSVGSDEGIRVWLNGKLVLSRDGLRALVPDEDQVPVDMLAGDNRLLVKVPQHIGPWSFCVRVLEPGTIVKRRAEIGPSLVALAADGFTLKTDVSGARADAEPVRVEVIGAGGKAMASTTAARGARIPVDAHGWPDGPYEIRSTTHGFDGRLFASHLPWYKGQSLTKARELAAVAAKADATTPEGFTLRILADMVADRLGGKLDQARGNPWWKIHSPLMEYDELMLERNGQSARIRPHGFLRLAYRDEIDGSPQFCRAYLPAGYDPAKKWPLVVQMHGFNPENPVYVRWWSADQRHADVDTEFPYHEQVIYIEPHGRGNTWYLGMGDRDVVRAIAEAKRRLSVDEDRVYLTGDSMGGWGTWHIASRHPELFAAIAPVFGGMDYHSVMSEEELGRLGPVERFLEEKHSTWSTAEALLNLPIYVRHGDQDQAVNVEYSRFAVRHLQRWGYDVRYQEYPGRKHEALESQSNGNMSIKWFLGHRRDPDPRHVRIRSADLRHASAYWAEVHQAATPLDFMVLDAEIVDRNVIRLDTRNVLEVELAPSTALVDRDQAVRVVWNGRGQVVRWQRGRLRLASPGYAPATLHKSRTLPGTIADFTVTPFAVVIGTTAQDPEMAALCQEKAMAFIRRWRDWQKQEPRVFKDTEITPADMARYSLLLVGGADANRVTAEIAGQLPLQIAKHRISIDGHAFLAHDAAVQMIYPNPRNADRYVWVVAGTSADGMYFNAVNPEARPDWDYVITDGRLPARKQPASPVQMQVVSGMFDHDWRFRKDLAHTGDAKLRAKGRIRHRPKPGFMVAPKLAEAYLGRYQIEKGPVVEVTKDGTRLVVKHAGNAVELVPETETSFDVPAGDLWLNFTRDDAGKVTGFTGYLGGELEAKKLD